MSSSYNDANVSLAAEEAPSSAAILNEQKTIRKAELMSSGTQNKNMGAMLDTLFRRTTMFFAFLVFILLFGIIITLFIGSLPALKAFGPGFFSSDVWNPVDIQFGGLVPIYGTFVTALIAMLIGVPVSFPTSGKDKLAVVGDLSTWLIDNAIDAMGGDAAPAMPVASGANRPPVPGSVPHVFESP